MAKILTTELVPPALDWAVAKCLGYFDNTPSYKGSSITVSHFLSMWEAQGHGVHWTHSSTDWAEGGPIIDREGISLLFCAGNLGEPSSYWSAVKEQQSWQYGYGPHHEQDEEASLQVCWSEVVKGHTPLIAAMRCLVASRFGETIDIPEELL